MTYTKYPNQVDTSTELPKATDLITPVNGETVNRLREAILAVENELGAQPSGTWSTVRARLDAMDTALLSLGADVDQIDPTIEILWDASSINANANAINFTGNVEVTDTGSGVSVEIIGGQASQVQEAFTATNGQTSFTLSEEPFQNSGVQMFVNGVKMRYIADYTVTGTAVSYLDDVTLVAGDEIEFWYLVDSTGLVTEGGGAALIVRDEGVVVDSEVTTLNFTGDATITNPSPGVISIAISGGTTIGNPWNTTDQVINDSGTFTIQSTVDTVIAATGDVSISASGAGIYFDASGGGEFYPTGDYIYIESLGFLDMVSEDGITMYQIRRTGDLPAQAIHMQGAHASADAVGATNRTGGSLIFEPGRGVTDGVDAAGPIYFGLGEPVSGYTEKGIMFGHGPSVGTLGDADYVPYTSHLGALRYQDGGLTLTSDVSLNLYTTNGTINLSASNGDISLYADSGAITLDNTPAGSDIYVTTEGEFYVASNSISISNNNSSASSLFYSQGTMEVTSRGYLTIASNRLGTSDIPSAAITIKGAQATTGSTGATNRRGGAIILESGRGRTIGTDNAGPIYLGLGDAVGTTVTNGLILGYGAAVGTLNDAAYIPYTTELARHTLVSDEYKISSSKSIRIESSGSSFTTVVGASTVTESTTGNIRVETSSYPRYWHAGNAAGGQIGDGQARLYAAADGTRFDLVFSNTVGLGWQINPAGVSALEIVAGVTSFDTLKGGTRRWRITDNGTSGGLATASGIQSFAMGDATTIASGDYSWASGYNVETTSTYGVSMGANIDNIGTAAVCIGENLSNSSDSANCSQIGFQQTIGANSPYASAIGCYVNIEANNTGAFVCGQNANVVANRPGSFQHSSGCTGYAGTGWIDMMRLCTAAPAALQNVMGGAFFPEAYSFGLYTIEVLGCTDDAAIMAHEIIRIPVKCAISDLTLGAPVVVESTMAAAGWSVAITEESAGELRITCDPGSDTVRFGARVSWSRIGATYNIA